jgi:hypothetical protein
MDGMKKSFMAEGMGPKNAYSVKVTSVYVNDHGCQP